MRARYIQKYLDMENTYLAWSIFIKITDRDRTWILSNNERLGNIFQKIEELKGIIKLMDISYSRDQVLRKGLELFTEFREDSQGG